MSSQETVFPPQSAKAILSFRKKSHTIENWNKSSAQPSAAVFQALPFWKLQTVCHYSLFPLWLAQSLEVHPFLPLVDGEKWIPALQALNGPRPLPSGFFLWGTALTASPGLGNNNSMVKNRGWEDSDKPKVFPCHWGQAWEDQQTGCPSGRMWTDGDPGLQGFAWEAKCVCGNTHTREQYVLMWQGCKINWM